MRIGGIRRLTWAIALLAAVSLWPMAGEASAKQAPLVAAAGDIACGANNPSFNGGYGVSNACQQGATSNLLGHKPYAAVLPLGDLQYDDNGSLASYAGSYEPTWGQFKATSHPAIGNHEYDDGLGAKGYWDYWNGVGVPRGRAGTRRRGWYSFNVGSWHLIALNSNCGFVSCYGTSRQLVWLRRELERNTDRCVLAYFHHARFSSGVHGDARQTRAFWRALYRGGADVVLSGHDHVYERFAPQRPSGALDRRLGIVQFTVGTGGYFLHQFVTTQPNSRFRWNSSFGILALRLARDRFGWSFITAPDNVSVDHGRRGCHNEEPQKRRRKRSG